MATNSPISDTRLKQICNDACDSAISTSTTYDHGQTQGWNNSIINSILKQLVSESGTTSEDAQSRYKFAVNSTIIQHLNDPTTDGDAEEGAQSMVEAVKEKVGLGEKKVGRRGMHSASGAYWNNERDGMWSHKYEGGEKKGMDIVISIMWIGV